MQSQQLLPKGEVLEEEFSSRAKGGDNPAEQMSKAHKHQVIIAKSAQRRFAAKSLILRTRTVLARHRGILLCTEPFSLPKNFAANRPTPVGRGSAPALT